MALEKFHFTTSTGETIAVHYLNDALGYRAAQKIRKKHGDDYEALMDAFIAAALDKNVQDKLDQMSIRDFSAFIKGWSEGDDDTASVGESSAS
ncbi:MAG: hypothetical protein Q4F65_12055 [Propionibacteriaceae bacterium]|nr:hypothetical protein [Propionibacteriaceae bacterium]